MPKYENIPVEVQACRFIKLVDLMRVIDMARRSSFSVHSVRTETYNVITKLKSMYVSESSRFPEEYHINATVGTVADLLSKLLSTLDFGENTPADNVGHRSNYNDKNLTHHKTCEAILNHLTNLSEGSAMHGVYNRCSFEKTYDLTWV